MSEAEETTNKSYEELEKDAFEQVNMYVVDLLVYTKIKLPEWNSESTGTATILQTIHRILQSILLNFSWKVSHSHESHT